MMSCCVVGVSAIVDAKNLDGRCRSIKEEDRAPRLEGRGPTRLGGRNHPTLGCYCVAASTEMLKTTADTRVD